MELQTEFYDEQVMVWPDTGRHILAQYDENTIVVYQAYKPSIGLAAVANQQLGDGGFSQSRMTWIKPNFLWMMFRCGWATKPDQEVVLAITLHRHGFDAMLQEAVHSSYVEAIYGDRPTWQTKVARNDVRLQWDPDDHGPRGEKKERRAIQLGIRGKALAHMLDSWTVRIEDVTSFVNEQRIQVGSGGLRTPRERVYPVNNKDVASKLGLSLFTP